MKVNKQLAWICSVYFLIGGVASGLEKVTLQLKWLHQFQFAGYYAAIEQGYYRDVGLEVELLEVTADEKPTEVVLNGKADFGVCSSDLLLMRAAGEPVVALAAIFQHSPHVIAAIKGDGIETIHDVVGKRVMMEPSSVDLIALLEAEQIPLETITFERHSFSPVPLYNGEVDAISAYITDEPFAIRELGKEPVMFSPRSAGIDFYGDILFTTEQYLEANRETVASFRFASLQGWKYAVEHPDEVIDWILAKYETEKSREALEYEAKQTINLIRPNVVEIGYMHMGRWEHMAEVFREMGMIETIPELDSMLYRKAIPMTERYPLKTIGVSALCIALIGLVSWKQRRDCRSLEAEIRRREESDRLLDERETEYRTIIESAPLPFMVWDTELVIRRWNREAEKLFGWSADQAIGQSALDLIIPPGAENTVEQCIKKLLTDDSHTQISENLTKDGRIVLCRWHTVPRRDVQGTITELHLIAADVTRDFEG